MARRKQHDASMAMRKAVQVEAEVVENGECERGAAAGREWARTGGYDELRGLDRLHMIARTAQGNGMGANEITDLLWFWVCCLRDDGEIAVQDIPDLAGEGAPALPFLLAFLKAVSDSAAAGFPWT